VGIGGVRYNLGTNSGLQHTFVDSTVKNGFTYYYAVVSYDFGYPQGEILPTESPIKISLQPDGSVVLGSNVVRVTPEAPAAGYIAPTLGKIDLTRGTTTGKIGYEIFDINLIQDGHVYNITFEDTLKLASSPSKPDTLTTKNFTLIDSTDNLVLIDKSTNFGEDFEQPITDGFQLKLSNEEKVEINFAESGWNSEGIMDFTLQKLVTRQGDKGEERPNDYEIIFGSLGFGRSTETLLPKLGITFPEIDVNFQVYNKSTKEFIEFGFIEFDLTGGAGLLTATGTSNDRIVFLEPDPSDSLIFTWWFFLDGDTSGGVRYPQDGDTCVVNLKKPFLSADKFRFVASAGKIDAAKAKDDLENIKVVPNPYIASARWEIKNPFNSGRGPRSLHFTHLPSKCTIRIFTVNGELVQTIRHDSPLNDGSEDWDMLSRDRLGISYGVYIFHVDAPGIGEKVGKFAVIK
jgi:hypothetical protein